MSFGICDMRYLIYVVAHSIYLTQQLYIFIRRTGTNFFSYNQLADKSTYTKSCNSGLLYKVLFLRIR